MGRSLAKQVISSSSLSLLFCYFALSFLLVFPSTAVSSPELSREKAELHDRGEGNKPQSKTSSKPPTSTTAAGHTGHSTPSIRPPPPDYPPHVPGTFGPFNPLSPVPGWKPLAINETVNYYEYHRHGDEDGKYVRSMCPAVNTLANRGYIPRTGRGVGYIDLVRKMKEVFNFGEDNGLIVVEPTFALHGYPKTIDLDMFGDEKVQHAVNCPAAPTREDFDVGDNIRIKDQYYQELLKSTSDGVAFSMEDFARHHHLRHNQSKEINPKFRYGHRDALCSLAQYANLVGIIGRLGKYGMGTVFLEDLKYFYEKEDFPPKWQRREWGYYSIEGGNYVDRMSNWVGFQIQRPFPASDLLPGADVEPLVAEFDKKCPFRKGKGGGYKERKSVWAEQYEEYKKKKREELR